MSRPPSGPLVHLVQEALEALLAPNVASVVLLEALAAGPYPGSDPGSLNRFVEGPLAGALRGWVSEATADEVLAQVRGYLDRVLGGRKPRPSQASTVYVAPERGPVRVVVLAARDRLAKGLLAALRPECVAPYHAPNARLATRMIASLQPSILLIDGTEILDDALLDAAAGDALVLVWASTEPGGRRALAHLAGRARYLVALPHPGGGELLVDYVRARRASER